MGLLTDFMIFAHRVGPDSMSILCVSVCLSEIISGPLKVIDIVGRRHRSYNVGLLLMIQIESWQNSSPFFWCSILLYDKIVNEPKMNSKSKMIPEIKTKKRIFKMMKILK